MRNTCTDEVTREILKYKKTMRNTDKKPKKMHQGDQTLVL